MFVHKIVIWANSKSQSLTTHHSSRERSATIYHSIKAIPLIRPVGTFSAEKAKDHHSSSRAQRGNLPLD